MGYPEGLLAPDEHLLLHRHPHWKMLFWPAVTFILATALAGFAAGVVSRRVDGPAQNTALIGILAVWAVLVLWRCAGAVIRWRTTHFVVTDRRVLVREGVLTHTGRDIPLNRIASVEFRNGLFERMLGTGTLIIDAASGDPLEYHDIPQVEQVHALLYHEVFDTPGGAPGYGRRFDRQSDTGYERGAPGYR